MSGVEFTLNERKEMNRSQRKRVRELKALGFISEIRDLSTLKRAMKIRDSSGLYPMRAMIHFGTQLNQRHWLAEVNRGSNIVRVVGDRAFVY